MIDNLNLNLNLLLSFKYYNNIKRAGYRADTQCDTFQV